MRHVAFYVPGEPKAQPRPRAFARGGKARVYNPHTSNEWKARVAIAAAKHFAADPIGKSLAMQLNFRLPRPRSHFGKDGLKPSAPVLPTGKPDIDNLAKAVIDALVGVGVLDDDCLVCLLTVTKRYADVNPGCDIEMSW